MDMPLITLKNIALLKCVCQFYKLLLESVGRLEIHQTFYSAQTALHKQKNYRHKYHQAEVENCSKKDYW